MILCYIYFNISTYFTSINNNFYWLLTRITTFKISREYEIESKISYQSTNMK
jgi:hypothetical protein